VAMEKDMEKLAYFDPSEPAERKRKKLQKHSTTKQRVRTKRETKLIASIVFFCFYPNVRFGVLLHECVQCSLTFTRSAIVVFGRGCIGIDERK